MMITMMMSRKSGCAIVKQIHNATSSERESINTAGLAEQKNKNKLFFSNTLVPKYKTSRRHETSLLLGCYSLTWVVLPFVHVVF